MSKKNNNTNSKETKNSTPQNDLEQNKETVKTQAEVIKASLNDMANAIDKDLSIDEITEKTEVEQSDHESLKQDTNNQEEVTKEELTTSEKSVDKENTTNTVTQSVPQAKPKGSGLALLLGLIGVGLGGYSVYHLKYEKANATNQTQSQVLSLKNTLDNVVAKQPNYDLLTNKLDDFDEKINKLSNKKKEASSKLLNQVTNLLSQQEQLFKDKKVIKKELEQLINFQKNLSTSGSDSEKQNAQQIAQLQQQFGQLLTEVGKSKLNNEISKSTQEATNKLNEKEVYYLISMAVNKLKIEKNTELAKELLEKAKEKIANSSLFSKELTQAINQQLAAINEIKVIDTQLIENQLSNIVKLSNELKAKTKQVPKEINSQTDKEKNGVLDKIKSIALSGIKFTPKDLSKVDISVETSLIEKRLIKADIEQLKFALKTQNQSDWNELLISLNDRLKTNFDQNEVFIKIYSNLQQLQSSEIVVKTPVLDSLEILLK